MRAASHFPEPHPPGQLYPAIGAGGRLPRRILMVRILAALGMAVLLIAVKPFISPTESWANSLSALPGGREMAPGLYVGGTVTDYDLQGLATHFEVDGEVDLGVPSIAEQVTASSLKLAYLYLPETPTAPLAWQQVSVLAEFMRSQVKKSSAVYIHDDIGGGRAVAAADMLLLVRGEPWNAVLNGMTPAQRHSLSAAQLAAIRQLAAALNAHDQPLPGNPYAAAKFVKW